MHHEEGSDQQGYTTETIPVEGVVGLSVTKYQRLGEATARSAFITVEGADIRYWASMDAGVALEPTLLEGHLVRDGGGIPLDSFNQIRRFRALRVEPGTTKLQVEYYR